MKNRRGNVAIEVAMFLPTLMLLLVGMYQIAQLTYTYYTLRKSVYAVATYLATQQGVNFCNNPSDPIITAAINYGVTGTTDGTQASLVSGLTTDMIVITPTSFDPVGLTAVPYNTDLCASGDTIPPDFINVFITNGVSVQPVIPFFATIQPFNLSPQVTVPYGGT